MIIRVRFEKTNMFVAVPHIETSEKRRKISKEKKYKFLVNLEDNIENDDNYAGYGELCLCPKHQKTELEKRRLERKLSFLIICNKPYAKSFLQDIVKCIMRIDTSDKYNGLFSKPLQPFDTLFVCRDKVTNEKIFSAWSCFGYKSDDPLSFFRFEQGKALQIL